MEHTTRPRMTTCHDALSMYIIHPMFPRPIGMMKVKTKLELVVRANSKKMNRLTGANAFKTKDENAKPFSESIIS